MTQVLRRTLKGQPYTFSANSHGWGVCPATSKTDRFHRSYQVYCDQQGTPLRCSCPDCVHRGSWCKHLREAERIRDERQPSRSAMLAEQAIRHGLPVERPSLCMVLTGRRTL